METYDYDGVHQGPTWTLTPSAEGIQIEIELRNELKDGDLQLFVSKETMTKILKRCDG